MIILNCTPHPINFIEGAEFDPKIRKFTGGHEVNSIFCNGILNAEIESVQTGVVEGTSIPIFEQRITGCDPLPDGLKEGDIVIVSALYATAYRQSGGTFPLYGVKDPVMTEDGKTFRGCRGLQKF